MKNVLCFGDSNTWGYVPAGKGKRYSRDVRWTGRLSALLGKDYYVIEEGLNSRTTVWSDPVKPDNKSGCDYLPACLQSHRPLDLVIIMLGSNDCKKRFGVDACTISKSMNRVIDIVLNSGAGRNFKAPKILLVAPPHIAEGEIPEEMGSESVEISRSLSPYYQELALLYGFSFIDGEKIHSVSKKDCLHLDEEGHKAFAKAIFALIKDILD